MAYHKNPLTEQEIKEALVRGHLTLEQRNLGTGYFGEVVQGRHKVTGEPYAVKLMIYNADFERYRRRELKALTKQEFISEPRIIQYYNTWVSTVENKQVLSIQMELCCCSLQSALNGNPSIVKDIAFYKHIFPQILKGLQVLHKAGWVHRDLHPGNILIANPMPKKIQDIKVKIADFGLARQLDIPGEPLSSQEKLEPISAITGRGFFRATELATTVYDYKVDLYSAGIILYILSCYVENANDEKWEQEIKQLHNSGIESCENLCHRDDYLLVNLIRDLVKGKAKERPTASEALERFNPSNDGDPPGVPMKFLARKDGEEVYTRCSSVKISLAGCRQVIEKELDIPQEKQCIFQDVNKDGKNITLHVKTDANVREMFRSAEEKHCTIYLRVSEKPQDGTATELTSPGHIDSMN